MKNIHVLETPNPSRLYLTTHEYIFEEGYSLSTDECENKHIYITSDEEIKEGDWILFQGILTKALEGEKFSGKEKIILTTDQDLIKDGVQAIDDELLEWFVKNPSCEEVEVKPLLSNNGRAFYGYKIIIPKEEPKQDKIMERFIANAKQETLEEATERLAKHFNIDFIAGAKWQKGQYTIEEQHIERSIGELEKEYIKGFNQGSYWQQERSYSEEEVLDILKELEIECVINPRRTEIREWFEQFSKLKNG